MLAVEVAVEVQQVRLEQRRLRSVVKGGVVECGSVTERDRSSVPAPVRPDVPARVDAHPWQRHTCRHRDVGRRESRARTPRVHRL